MAEFLMQYWMPLAAGTAGAVLLFGKELWGFATKAATQLKRTAVEPAKPDRKLALDSADDVIAYLESIGCKEGVDYFKAGLVHLYHKHSE